MTKEQSKHQRTMSKKLKSGIIGRAGVIFGDAIDIKLGTSQNAESETMAVGMTELKHKKAKGDNHFQVVLVFPNLDALKNFRNTLDQMEVELKERIVQEEAQQTSSRHS